MHPSKAVTQLAWRLDHRPENHSDSGTTSTNWTELDHEHLQLAVASDDASLRLVTVTGAESIVNSTGIE